jgi:hypothetical protein
VLFLFDVWYQALISGSKYNTGTHQQIDEHKMTQGGRAGPGAMFESPAVTVIPSLATASSVSVSGHVVNSANENWLTASKKDATRITQLWESMLSASTDSGKGGMQIGWNSSLRFVGLNNEWIARQKINLHKQSL